MKKTFFASSILLIVLFFSCKKDSVITSPEAGLSISIDTVKFDTVFTSTGSVTKSLKIFNENSQRLRMDIKLMGGAASPFRININGTAATEMNQLEVAAEDSIYVFVSVSVNPTSAPLPFVLSDSISIKYNGNTRWIQLQAYGQNAVFLDNTVITTNTSWNTSLPYVILGSLLVAPNATLTIPAGTRVYAHADAPLIVDGTLLVNGTHEDNVQFSGDRLDDPYDKFPASWPGIYFRAGSKNNVISFAIIKNAYQAIAVFEPSVNANPKLILHQSVIDNAYDAGLLLSNTFVQADNCLVSNCGTNIAIESGGNYNFTNCTVVTISNSYILHKTAVVKAGNFLETNGSTTTKDLNALFKNCIFWGDNNTLESELDIKKQGNNIFSVTLDHCLYKANTAPANATLLSSLDNMDPQFDSVDVRANYYDFRLTKYASPAINAGSAITFTKDLDNNNRSVGVTDIGCYEKQ
ncbi:hypothetical protein [Ferruginibacter sp. HRS2-29]|uniref:hypothetical protein n=1 Tax=Ferruginibacter sp. HRS2-29 TaxID=2487334 RepID=UPI0020CCF326|nr:hypothetical protein [Ferruginibacter sp. HRS2-29]MCP9752762.1 hypothetical protein [Ferruginibacter sp. HRS2-29]